MFISTYISKHKKYSHSQGLKTSSQNFSSSREEKIFCLPKLSIISLVEANLRFLKLAQLEEPLLTHVHNSFSFIVHVLSEFREGFCFINSIKLNKT